LMLMPIQYTYSIYHEMFSKSAFLIFGMSEYVVDIDSKF
jgi:hypothetical protein